MLTADEIKAKYYALEVISSSNNMDIANISGSLDTSKIDLNPHQIEAAIFALKSPVSDGSILADEVGLGKTIEAGLVISEYYSKGKTSIIVVAPASLCQQWQVEMQEKFDIPAKIIDTKIYNTTLKEKAGDPLDYKGIIICSYNCAVQLRSRMSSHNWDLVVIDEAHKLRNFCKGKTKIADGINKAFLGKKKLLLTATPIQNSLMDIYSLATIIDPNIFGNELIFQEHYVDDSHYTELQNRLKPLLHRTLRRDVTEYIKYTNREAMTVAFNPTKAEEELYQEVSLYIQDISKIAITTRFRTLIVLMIRKLMSSSTSAVKGTLENLLVRLENISKQNAKINGDNIDDYIKDDDLISEYNDELEDYPHIEIKLINFSKQELQEEKAYLKKLIAKASAIKVDGKTEKLIDAINKGFAKIKEKGGQRKAIIFTESNRTLKYLFDYLTDHGFADKIVTFNGQNNSALCNKIYTDFIEKYSSELTGSRTNDMKKALVTAFKENAEIMIATEAAAEGLNLQFCSLLVNYDLPWNPQRVEQRIGRVHRYGQKCDVVIINFINKTNVADVRLYQILQNKFKLFDGVFGASDEILGTLSDGVDFEKAVASIFEMCRTTDEINRAFDALQATLGAQKEERIEEAKQLVLENLNPTTQEKLQVIKTRVADYMERRAQIFWYLSMVMLRKNHPKLFINDKMHLFGKSKEQVFNTNTNVNFDANSTYKLDFTKRDNSVNGIAPQPFNPDTELGHKILDEALSQPADDTLHLVLQKNSKLTAGHKGRLKMSLFTLKTPNISNHLIYTIINDQGGLLNLNAQDIFDNVTDIIPSPPMGFQDLINQVHEQNVKSYEKAEKKRIDSILKEEVDKLNRWLIDEKQSIGLKTEKMKNKITNLKRQFKMERNFEAKLALGNEIKTLQKQMIDSDFNAFDTELELEKKCTRLITEKKRSLKMDYSIDPVFNLTWEVK